MSISVLLCAWPFKMPGEYGAGASDSLEARGSRTTESKKRRSMVGSLNCHPSTWHALPGPSVHPDHLSGSPTMGLLMGLARSWEDHKIKLHCRRQNYLKVKNMSQVGWKHHVSFFTGGSCFIWQSSSRSNKITERILGNQWICFEGSFLVMCCYRDVLASERSLGMPDAVNRHTRSSSICSVLPI